MNGVGVETAKKSYCENGSANNAISAEKRAHDEEVAALQRGNSSAFSKDFPALNDPILKPVIHYT